MWQDKVGGGGCPLGERERPLSWLMLWFSSPCDASWSSLGFGLAFARVVQRGDKALIPKASPKQNEKSKDNAVFKVYLF